MLLTSRIQSAELIVEENANGSQGGNAAIPLFSSICPPSLYVNDFPTVRHRSRVVHCPDATSDD